MYVDEGMPLNTNRHSVSWPVSLHDAWWPDKIQKTNEIIFDLHWFNSVQVPGLQYASEAVRLEGKAEVKL